MELLIAFLIAFGVVNEGSKELKVMTERDAYELVQKKELEKEFIIYGAEADDF